MGVNFKEAFTYLFKDESWKLKFSVLAIFTFISTLLIILWKNFFIGIPLGLFNLGFIILLTGNLINESVQVLPDFNIKKIFKTGLKFYGVIFTYLALYIITILIWTVTQLIVVGANIFAGKIYHSSNIGLFKQLISVEMIAGFIVLAIILAFTLFIDAFIKLLFSENFSFKESFNIKKIFNVFGKNPGAYLLIFVFSVFAYAPAGLIYNTAFIYDNTAILIFVLLISSFITTFFSFAITNIMTQAYKQSLAKINQDESKLESLKHSLNSFDYKVIGLTIFASVALMTAFFILPISENSSFGKLKTQLSHNKSRVKDDVPMSYNFRHYWGCKSDRYNLNKPLLFPIIKDGKMGYIDKTGKIIIKPQFTYADDFYEGLAIVSVGGNRNNKDFDLYDYDHSPNAKYGYINTKGEFVIQPVYKSANIFINGAAYVSTEKKKGYINKNGDFLPELKIDNKKHFYKGLSEFVVNKKIGFIDKNGKIIINPIYDNIHYYSEGLIIVEKNGRMGAINSKGDVIIDIKYDYLSPFREGLAVIVLNKKYGFINENNEIVIRPQFNDACNFSEGLADVTYDNTGNGIGYINKTGKFVINPQYEGNFGFINGIAPVKVNGKWGYINKAGKYIWKPTN